MKAYLGTGPIFVAGGSSGVGLEIVKQLVAAGSPVKALVRRPEAKTMLEEMKGVTAVLGDAKDEAAVQNCLDGCVAAVTTLGGKTDDGYESITLVIATSLNRLAFWVVNELLWLQVWVVVQRRELYRHKFTLSWKKH